MQRGSPGRKTGALSRMSEPTATKGGLMNSDWSSTSFHAPAVRLNTTQRWTGQQVGIGPIAITIAWLPGPVNGPQSSCSTGFGNRKALSSCSAMSWRAVACEHVPDALGVADDVAADTLASVTTTTAKPSRTMDGSSWSNDLDDAAPASISTGCAYGCPRDTNATRKGRERERQGKRVEDLDLQQVSAGEEEPGVDVGQVRPGLPLELARAKREGVDEVERP